MLTTELPREHRRTRPPFLDEKNLLLLLGEQLGMSKSTFDRMKREGLLPPRMPRSKLWSKRLVMAWVAGKYEPTLTRSSFQRDFAKRFEMKLLNWDVVGEDNRFVQTPGDTEPDRPFEKKRGVEPLERLIMLLSNAQTRECMRLRFGSTNQDRMSHAKISLHAGVHVKTVGRRIRAGCDALEGMIDRGVDTLLDAVRMVVSGAGLPDIMPRPRVDTAFEGRGDLRCIASLDLADIVDSPQVQLFGYIVDGRFAGEIALDGVALRRRYHRIDMIHPGALTTTIARGPRQRRTHS